MKRTIVYKLKPTVAQAEGLQRYLDVTRALYNAALEQRIAAYTQASETRSWVVQSRELREVREAGLLEGCHVHAAQLALRRLERAYQAFFRRCAKQARRKGPPRFKSRRHWRSFGFKEYGGGWRIDLPGRRLKITAVGAICVRVHRQLPGPPKTLSVVRKPDGWYAHITCEVPDRPPLADVDPKRRAALDLGIEALATLHTGERIENIRPLARKQRGSNRRRKQAERLAKAHQKLARVRRDHLHKQSTRLAARYTLIAVEDLTVTALSASARGTRKQPGRQVRQKAALNRSILDGAWGEFLKLLEYKLKAQGGQLIRVDARGTSQRCPRCGQTVHKTLAARRHDCPHCGLSLDRDHNAAINIYKRAWAVPVAEAA